MTEATISLTFEPFPLTFYFTSLRIYPFIWFRKSSKGVHNDACPLTEPLYIIYHVFKKCRVNIATLFF